MGLEVKEGPRDGGGDRAPAALVGIDLAFSYPGRHRPALDAVSLTVTPGRRIAVVGPNGSGKTTLLKLLKGLLPLSQGEVSIDGAAPDDGEPPAALAVGYVFQDPDDQIVGTRVDEDVAFGPENLYVAGDELADKVASALGRAGIEHLAQREPHTLSGGEKQRLAIAGALALAPRYLLLDEPTAMLDPEGRRQVRKVIDDLLAAGDVGIVEVTHDLSEALDAHEVLLLAGGRQAARGAPREVLGDSAALEGIGLAALPVSRVAAELRRVGVPVEGEPLTVDELLAVL